ncbi:MAG TPA: DUF1565 domain-containing protein, partial [Rhodothermales bacterium]|nr:DUF1565 domain-containing protein [Rhodothermales bacterium]
MRLLTSFCCLLVACLLLVPVDAYGQFNKIKKKAQEAQRKVERTTSKAEQTTSTASGTADRTQDENAPLPAGAAVDIYVSPEGSNKNDGSKGSPMKNIDKALEKAPEGARIHVTEGVYTGTFGVGYWEIHKPVELYGGYSTDFSTRDPFTHLTLLQPPADAFDKSASRHVMEVKKPINGVVVDGFIFEGGVKTPYDPEKGKPEGVETGRMKWEPKNKNP